MGVERDKLDKRKRALVLADGHFVHPEAVTFYETCCSSPLLPGSFSLFEHSSLSFDSVHSGTLVESYLKY